MAEINCEKYAKLAFGIPFNEKNFFLLYECLVTSNFVFKVLSSFQNLTKEEKEDIFSNKLLFIYSEAEKGSFKWDEKTSQFSTYFSRVIFNSAIDRVKRNEKHSEFNSNIHITSKTDNAKGSDDFKRVNKFNPISVAANNSIYFSKIKISNKNPDYSKIDVNANPILRHAIITNNISIETVQKIVSDFKNDSTIFDSLNLLKTRYNSWHSAK